MVKFDMHCHAKEGSLDAKISIFEYVRELKRLGYQGMLITDHDSYRSYRVWNAYQKRHPEETFTVIKGIEYDTIDAGHFLVILPDTVHLHVLEIRGLPVRLLAAVVHRYGGILGPAHPYGSRSTSLVRASRYPGYGEILHQVDFVEIFNAAETGMSNRQAVIMADEINKPGIAGSDSHRSFGLGTGYTVFDREITGAGDLIQAIRDNRILRVGGISRGEGKNPLINSRPVEFAFQCYNRGMALARCRSRARYLREAAS